MREQSGQVWLTAIRPLAKANSLPFGLHAALFTRDVELTQFGIAIHPLMDSFSPAHVSGGEPLVWPYNEPQHSPFEGVGIEDLSHLTLSIKIEASWGIWNAYEKVFLK